MENDLAPQTPAQLALRQTFVKDGWCGDLLEKLLAMYDEDGQLLDGYIDFDGQNCNDCIEDDQAPCAGWDRLSRRDAIAEIGEWIRLMEEGTSTPKPTDLTRIQAQLRKTTQKQA
jgi:hypothetical protein